jgi:Flp pilus assembly protein CpaB
MLLLGGVLALLAFFVLYIGLTAASGNQAPPVGTPTPEPKAQVVVAATDIPAYTVLKEDMLTIKEVELSTVLSNTTATTVDLIGRMTTRDYQQDAQVQLDSITDPGISQILTKGQRAFVLAIQEVNNFGGQLVDGDTVDLIWTRTFETSQAVVNPSGDPGEKTATLPTTKTLLQNLKVLRMIPLRAGTAKNNSSSSPINSDASLESGTSSDTDSEAAQAAALQSLYADTATGGTEPAYSAAAVLAVTDQQAEVIKFARENGVISLALRAKDDTETETTTGITDKILVQDYGLIAPEIVLK